MIAGENEGHMTKPPSQLNLSPATRAAQALHRINEITGAVVPDIALASTFARDENYNPRQSYIYARDGGPTVEHAEAILADLDGAAGSLLFGSGMAAAVTLFESLPVGAHVVAPNVMYHGVLTWLHRQASRGVLRLTTFDAANPDALARAVVPGDTALVWTETPINPNWDVVDIAAAAKTAHAAGAKLAVDCTAASPCTTQALALGADIVFHSATKYLNGHSDITGGVLSVAHAGPEWDELRKVRTLMGSVMAAFEAWLLIRGMRTLFVRFERASANALTIAQHFENHPKIAKVLYPGLPSHPGHAIAKHQMMHGFGGMLSILAQSGDAARRIARATQLFLPATSLGGVESLIEHRKAVEGPHSIVPDTLLRLSVGIEDVNDLIADLEQALEQA